VQELHAAEFTPTDVALDDLVEQRALRGTTVLVG
jgi:hypothetical protein